MVSGTESRGFDVTPIVTWSLTARVNQGGIRPKTHYVDMTVTAIQKVIASAVIAQETA